MYKNIAIGTIYKNIAIGKMCSKLHRTLEQQFGTRKIPWINWVMRCHFCDSGRRRLGKFWSYLCIVNEYSLSGTTLENRVNLTKASA